MALWLGPKVRAHNSSAVRRNNDDPEPMQFLWVKVITGVRRLAPIEENVTIVAEACEGSVGFEVARQHEAHRE